MAAIDTPEVRAFFAGHAAGARLYPAVARCVASLAGVTTRVTKSQIAWRRRRAFAWVWTPDRYLHGHTAPLVLSVALPHHDASSRWKEVVEPRPDHFMHHLELHDAADIDDEVRRWLHEAWLHAG